MTQRTTFAFAIIVILGLNLAPTPASADTATTFGMNPRSMGLGKAYTAVAEDMAALYFNPAGLIQLEGVTVATGLLVGLPNLDEDGARLTLPDETSYYLHVGLPLSGALKEHLAFGVSLNMPWGKLLGARLYQKQEPYFVLYDASVQLLQFRAGGAGRIPWKPLSFLTIGGSIQVLGSVVGDIAFFSPFQRTGPQGPDDPDARVEMWADIDVPTATFYTVGAMAFLGQRWRLGITYNSSQHITVKFPISFTTRLDVSDTFRPTIPVDAVATFTTKYHPQQLTMGLSYRTERLLLSADLSWIDYSSYAIPYPVADLDLQKLQQDQDLKLLLGPDSVLLDPHEPRMQWQDTLVPRIGGEYRLLGWLSLRGGYSYERSPLQSTNFPIFDCDKHSLALGGRASFLKPWGLLPGWLHLDLTLQELLYVGRDVLGSRVGGHVFAVASGLEMSIL